MGHTDASVTVKAGSYLRGATGIALARPVASAPVRPNAPAGRCARLPVRTVTRAIACLSALFVLFTAPGLVPRTLAQDAATAAPKAEVQDIKLTFVRQDTDELPPLSLLDFIPEDIGTAGAKLAIDDNNTTGRFLKQKFTLDTIVSKDPGELVEAVKARHAAGIGLFVVAVEPDTLLTISDALAGKDAIVFNAGAADDRLRQEDCRLNVKHTAPSRAMLADTLAQYLFWKRWRDIVLVTGPGDKDRLFADAIRRSARKFKLKIVAEKEFEYKAGSRRADGGFEQVQKQIPSFTQDFPDYDVLIVADELFQFGHYFPYRTWLPRPVAGTQGLYPTSWHPASELWGATQFQNRFNRLANRDMRPLDYQVWTAVRAIGEAATRTRSAEPKTLIDYMLSDKFEIAAFKGQKLTFREWNGQLRQPLFIATDKLHVTVSPQEGFLHRNSELDTLGYDEPESKCTAFRNKS